MSITARIQPAGHDSIFLTVLPVMPEVDSYIVVRMPNKQSMKVKVSDIMIFGQDSHGEMSEPHVWVRVLVQGQYIGL